MRKSEVRKTHKAMSAAFKGPRFGYNVNTCAAAKDAEMGKILRLHLKQGDLTHGPRGRAPYDIIYDAQTNLLIPPQGAKMFNPPRKSDEKSSNPIATPAREIKKKFKNIRQQKGKTFLGTTTGVGSVWVSWVALNQKSLERVFFYRWGRTRSFFFVF